MSEYADELRLVGLESVRTPEAFLEVSTWREDLKKFCKRNWRVYSELLGSGRIRNSRALIAPSGSAIRCFPIEAPRHCLQRGSQAERGRNFGKGKYEEEQG